MKVFLWWRTWTWETQHTNEEFKFLLMLHINCRNSGAPGRNNENNVSSAQSGPPPSLSSLNAENRRRTWFSTSRLHAVATERRDAVHSVGLLPCSGLYSPKQTSTNPPVPSVNLLLHMSPDYERSVHSSTWRRNSSAAWREHSSLFSLRSLASGLEATSWRLLLNAANTATSSAKNTRNYTPLLLSWF